MRIVIIIICAAVYYYIINIIRETLMICHGSYFEFASLNVYSSDYNNHKIYYNIGDQVRKKIKMA